MSWPLYSLVLLSLSLFGAFLSYFCFKAEKKQGRLLYATGFAILTVAMVMIAFLVFLGFTEISNFAFKLIVRMISIILIARLFICIVKEGLNWLVFRSPFKENPLLVSQGSMIVGKTLSIIYTIGFVLVFIVFLITWHFFDTPLEAVQGISSLGISFGNYKVTVGMIAGVVLVVSGAYIVSWIIQTLLKQKFFMMMNISSDVGESIAKIVHYSIMLLSILLVLLILGFSLTNLTIIAGSLGIGVGLGLQEVVKNFAAGLLVLFERPLRVGDEIEFDGGPCRVKRIGLRSTLIQTKSDTEIVIPNNDLITNPLVNWTLSQKRYRVKIPIGVGYNSDVAEVMRIMKECGEGCQGVLHVPSPQVIFMEFGESTLNFEMRVWITNVDKRRAVQTEINIELEKRFRQAGISIAYPQLDVHIHQSPNLEADPR